MRPPPARFIWLDLLRGVGAVLVVLCHTRMLTEASAPWQKLLWAPIYQAQAGLYMFFAISGFCIHRSTARMLARDPEAQVQFFPFWRRRLRRLYPPYLLALLLYAALEALAHPLPPDRVWFRELGSHLLFLYNFDRHSAYHFCGVFWTLVIEEQLYLAYFLLLRWRKQWSWGAILLAVLGLRCAWYFGSQYLPGRFPNWPTAEFWLPHWLPWVFGAVSAEWEIGNLKLPPWTRDFRLAGAALVAAGLLSELRDFYWTDLVAYPLWCVGFFFLINAGMVWEKGRPQLPRGLTLVAWLGTASYSIYLLHTLFIEHLAGAAATWWRMPLTSDLRLAFVPLALLAGAGYYQWWERRFLNTPGT